MHVNMILKNVSWHYLIISERCHFAGIRQFLSGAPINARLINNANKETYVGVANDIIIVKGTNDHMKAMFLHALVINYNDNNTPHAEEGELIIIGPSSNKKVVSNLKFKLDWGGYIHVNRLFLHWDSKVAIKNYDLIRIKLLFIIYLNKRYIHSGKVHYHVVSSMRNCKVCN